MPNTSPGDTTRLWQLLQAKDGACAKRALDVALAHSAFDVSVQSGALDRASVSQGLYDDLPAGQRGNWQPFLDRLRMLGTTLATSDTEYRCLHEIAEALRSALS